MKKNKKEAVPKWILSHLKRFGNCSCGYDIVKRYGKNKLLIILENLGYKCSLKIVSDPDSNKKSKQKYPKNAYYILEVDEVLKNSIE